MSIYTVGDKPLVGRFGQAIQTPVAGAPNGATFGDVTIQATSEGTRFFTIDQATALPGTYLGLRMLIYGFDGDEAVTVSWNVPAAKLAELQANTGSILLGYEGDVLKRRAGMAIDALRFVPRNASGEGACDLLVPGVSNPEPETFVVNANPVLAGSQTEGAAVALTPLDWTGEPDVTITLKYQMAQDTGGTSAGAEFDATGIVPSISGALDCFRVVAYAAGPGVASPSTGYPSNWVAITSATVVTPVTLNTAAQFATQKLNLDAMGGAVPSSGLLTSGTASAPIVAYVAGSTSGTGTAFLGEITNGPIADNAPCSWSGGSGAANGASVAYPLTAGLPFYVKPPVFNGTVTNEPHPVIHEVADDAAGTGKIALDLTGTIPPWYGTSYYRRTDRIAGYGISGTSDFSTPWTAIGIPTLAVPADADWPTIIVSAVSGGDRLDEIYIKSSLNVSRVWWTTSSQQQIDATPFPAGHEPMTLIGTITVSGVTYQRWGAADAIYSGRNFRIFGSLDGTRRTQLAIRYEIGGAISPVSNRKTVPGSVVANSDRVRYINKSDIQDGLGDPGGCCMQFPRGFDCDGNYVLMSFDVCGPCESPDFGDNWNVAPDDGLWISQSCCGICIDGERVHGLFGAEFMRGVGSSYNSKEGAYYFNRTTKKWKFGKALPDIFGSNTGNDARVNQRAIAKVAGSGSVTATGTGNGTFVYSPAAGIPDGVYTFTLTSAATNGGTFTGVGPGSLALGAWTVGTERTYTHPDGWSLKLKINDGSTDFTIGKVFTLTIGPATRTLYLVYAPSKTEDGFTNLQIYKSTDGGDSWATDGGTLAVGTVGKPVGLLADATALYLHTLTGVRRRPIGDTTWTAATWPAGVSGSALNLEKRGTTIYASRSGKGLYTATDADTLAFSLKKTFNIRTFSVCPTNVNRIILVSNDDALKSIVTHNNGSVWDDVENQQFPGQPNDFAHKLYGSPAWVMWHPTDQNVVLAMRFQHPGKSTDGGKTFAWSSRNLDYSEIRTVAFHSTDPYRLMFGMTDRLVVASDHGARFVLDDNISTADKNTIRANIDGGSYALTARGALMLENGTRTGYVCQVGKHPQNKVPVFLARQVSLTRTQQTTSNGVPGTGNGDVTYTASPNLPAGRYVLTCTTAATNGGTFTGVGPAGVALGTWTVGTQRTYTHPRGGTLQVLIADGSTDFTAGANPCVITITVNPVGGARTILDPSVMDIAYFSASDPSDQSRGISGRHKFSMDASGTITLDGTISNSFVGFMGTSGDVLLAYSGNGTLMRSTNGGSSFTSWATGVGNYMARSSMPAICASSHNNARAYVGINNGIVYKVQDGTKSIIFDFDAWAVANGISGDWGGAAVRNGRNVPMISGVAESFFDPNLVYCCTYFFGAPYCFFRTENALAASPTWENITFDAANRGLVQPIQNMTIHPLTDEPILFSAHGTVFVKPKQAHRTAYNITASIVDDLQAAPGGDYHKTQKI